MFRTQPPGGAKRGRVEQTGQANGVQMIRGGNDSVGGGEGHLITATVPVVVGVADTAART
jgi:hypothetical protein